MKRTLAALVAILAIFGFSAGANAQTTTQQPPPPSSPPPMGQPSMGQPRAGTSQPAHRSQSVTSEYRQAQQLLKQQGYYSGPVDGKWGRQSRAAVTKYQQDKGIRATGTLDAETMASLGMRS